MSSAPSSTEVMTEVLAAKGKGKERMTLQGPLDYELPTSPVTASSATTSASASAIASSATVSREDSIASTLVFGAEPLISKDSACSGAPFRGTGMKVFDIQIPSDLEQRFETLQSIYSPALYSHLLGKRGFLSSRRTKKIDTGACDFSMKWKYLGESEEAAKLYIVIQCGAGVGKKVRRFFSQDHVLENLRTDFQIKVIEASLRRLMMEVDTFISGDSQAEDTTLCGRTLRLSSGDTSRLATLGGVIMVSNNGIQVCYGLTAGHPAQEMRRLSTEDDEYGESDSEEVSDSTDGDADEGGSTSGSDWSIVLQDKDKHILEPKEEVMKAHFSQFLGVISHDSFRDHEMTTNHDWALVNLPPQEVLPNFVGGSRELSAFRSVSVSLPVSVAVLSNRGLQYGKLTQKQAGLLMSPSKRATRTLDFIPHPESHLLHGDSGAWVVHPTNGHVYGHLVAVDAFGEGYVIPMQQTLNSIQEYLPAARVHLPSPEELEVYFDIVKNDPQIGPPKNAQKLTKQTTRNQTACLACRARRIKCDEKKPICNRCRHAHLDCQGIQYDGHTMSSPAKSSTATDIPRSAYDKALSYYQTIILPAVTPETQRVWGASLGNANLSSDNFIFSVACERISILSRSRGRLLEIGEEPSLDDAWQECNGYMSKYLTVVNMGLTTRTGRENLAASLLYIANFFVYEKFAGGNKWQAHGKGYFAVIQFLGGVNAVLRMRMPAPPIENLAFMVTQCAGANTTSPATMQVSGFSSLTDGDIKAAYGGLIISAMPCPPHLFLAICHITELRVQVAAGDAGPALQSRMEAISNSINNHDLIAVWPTKHGKQVTDETNIKAMVDELFQLAVRLYGILTLVEPVDRKPSIASAAGDSSKPKQSEDGLRDLHRRELISRLRSVWHNIEDAGSLRWPFIVAGVAVADGAAADQEFVADALRLIWASPIPNWGAFKCLEKLRKFWASGKTGWEDCFDEPVPCLL